MPADKYNSDWAILKQNGGPLYLVRETKGTRDFLKLRTSEADKVRRGRKHFDVASRLAASRAVRAAHSRRPSHPSSEHSGTLLSAYG